MIKKKELFEESGFCKMVLEDVQKQTTYMIKLQDVSVIEGAIQEAALVIHAWSMLASNSTLCLPWVGPLG